MRGVRDLFRGWVVRERSWRRALRGACRPGVKRRWAGMSVPPLLDLASWSPAPTMDSRSSATSDDSPRVGASLELDLPSPRTPLQMSGDSELRLRQLSFQGDDVSSPSEDEGEDDEQAVVDMVAPSGAQLQIHLFPTYATLQESGEWKVNVHGWVFDPPPEAAVTPGRRWVGHRVSRNLACRILGLTELGIDDDIETEGNRAIFRRRRSWLFRRTVPGRAVEVTVGSTTLMSTCDYAGHFHVSGEVQEHELSNFAGLGLREQEEERLSSHGGAEGVTRMTKSASFSASLSELAPEQGAVEVQLPLAAETQAYSAQQLPFPVPASADLEPEPEPEPAAAGAAAGAAPICFSAKAECRNGSASFPQRATPVSSPSMGGVSVVNVVATGATAPAPRQGLWRGGRQHRLGGSPRLFTPAAAELLLIPPTGLSIISDIDDTVKLSDVLNKRELLRNTFLREFVPVDGMAALYQHWEQQHDAVFHYVSASPWQLQPELEAFLRSSGFPLATFHLKSVRVNALPGSGDSLLNLLEKGASFKPRHIEQLMQNFPRRSFWLVGDSGEQDPEAYGRVALACRDHPDREPVRIFIRTVEGANNSEERFLKAFEGLDAESWTLFGDPAELQDRVIRAA